MEGPFSLSWCSLEIAKVLRTSVVQLTVHSFDKRGVVVRPLVRDMHGTHRRTNQPGPGDLHRRGCSFLEGGLELKSAHSPSLLISPQPLASSRWHIRSTAELTAVSTMASISDWVMVTLSPALTGAAMFGSFLLISVGEPS